MTNDTISFMDERKAAKAKTLIVKRCLPKRIKSDCINSEEDWIDEQCSTLETNLKKYSERSQGPNWSKFKQSRSKHERQEQYSMLRDA